MRDIFGRVSNEATKLMRLSEKRTLTSMEVQSATRLILPGELCKHAIQDGQKAVMKFKLTAEAPHDEDLNEEDMEM